MFHVISNIGYPFKTDEYIEKYDEYLGKIRKYIQLGQLDLKKLHSQIESEIENHGNNVKVKKKVRGAPDLDKVTLYNTEDFDDTF